MRAKARELGYGEVGFVRFDKRYIYSSRRSHVRQDLPNAICLAVEQDYVKTQEIPGITAEEAQGVKDKKDKVSPQDFFVTMAYALGLEYNKKYLSLDKREFAMNNQGKGRPVTALFQAT